MFMFIADCFNNRKRAMPGILLQRVPAGVLMPDITNTLSHNMFGHFLLGCSQTNTY